jgi:cysteine desulfurase/selenocysteine lyase
VGCRSIRHSTQYVTPESIEKLIDAQTAVVCLSHVEYSTGQTYDLKRFADLAHEHDALLIVDATQSAGQVPVDVAITGVDAVATSTYKWICGPFGTGFMYLSPELQETHPGIVGWRSHKDMWDFQADRLEYPRSAKRYEFGTMAYGTALGAAEAISYLLDLGIEDIATITARSRMNFAPGSKTLAPRFCRRKTFPNVRPPFAARFPGQDSAAFAAALKKQGIVASLRRDFIRFSPHLYNNSDDVETALLAIHDGLGR